MRYGGTAVPCGERATLVLDSSSPAAAVTAAPHNARLLASGVCNVLPESVTIPAIRDQCKKLKNVTHSVVTTACAHEASLDQVQLSYQRAKVKHSEKS